MLDKIKAKTLCERLEEAENNRMRWCLSGASGEIGLAFQRRYAQNMYTLKRQILLYRKEK